MAKKSFRPQRIYRGNIPANGTLLASNDEWSVYRMDVKGGYLNVKVVAHTPRARKANFWLGWHITMKRFAAKNDAKQLAHYPALHDWIVQLMLETA